jgi:Mg-chelatase subunit ChlD
MSRFTVRRWLAVSAALVVGALAQALPAFGADTFTPNPVNVTLQAGASTDISKTLHLDALPGAADIIIAIDTTGSMASAIAQAKAQATQLCTDVQNQIPGARFAVFDFRDVPDRPAPANGVLILTPVFTSSCAAVQAAINTMAAGGGGDFPEAYNWVFNKAYSDPVLDASRNPAAVQFLVVLGDAPPHNSPAPTVAPACGNQPPADAGINSTSEIGGLNANDITLLMINYGAQLSCYQQLAGATGGTAVNAGADLSGTIIGQIQAAAAHIDSVNLVVSGACPPVGISFNPLPPYGPFTAPVDISFTETITAPTVPGVYSCTVTAVVDGTARAVQTVNVTVTPANPATLTLAPKTATNVVDAQHCVTATVKDAFMNATPGITVRFTVTGAVNTTGAVVTNAAGQAQFCYTGPGLPGADVITAFADTNGNGTQDAGEPGDTAAKTWILPTSTAGCKVTNGGRITATNGDKATFGGNAKANGLQGEEEYQDHGPATDINVHSINVQAVTCNAAGTSASIFGTATINGAGSFDYRIDVVDNGEPGAGSDTYRIRLSNGYDSGVQTLAGGNIQLH